MTTKLDRVLETVLYCRNENRDEVMQFYDDVLCLRENRLFSEKSGLYRLGATVLLVFNADETTVKQSPPATGTTGRAHTCFVVGPAQFEDWKQRVQRAGVEIIDEIEWAPPLKGRSFYFNDPAGNVLEIADRDIWPEQAAES